MSNYQSTSNTLGIFIDSLVFIGMQLISGSPTDIHVFKRFIRMRGTLRTM